nr:T-complex protein 1 subunit epsilon [Ipomoea batatas]GME08444.1 T-complex protein 1 subunit epsilon [Ipomoea batatas]
MSDHASAESVQALQTAVEAIQAEQGEIRQLLRQLLAGKGPAGDDSGSPSHGSAPAAAPATAAAPVASATVPKFKRLEFPCYDGIEDPTGWLHRCEKFFRTQGTLKPIS